MEERFRIDGPRFEIARGTKDYPDVFEAVPEPPERLYVIGDPSALKEGLAVVGARKATPYGLNATKMLAGRAAELGVVVISGGARGCDAAAHEAALAAGGQTVAFLGGGCDEPYPKSNVDLFRRIVKGGGVVASEFPWHYPPKPFMFRKRNRLIAGLARATLIVEAGLPSGTFSTADEALAANKDVLAVPGSIFSATSAGSNMLLAQGAMPIVSKEVLDSAIMSLFPEIVGGGYGAEQLALFAGDGADAGVDDPILSALAAALCVSKRLLPYSLMATIPWPRRRALWRMCRCSKGRARSLVFPMAGSALLDSLRAFMNCHAGVLSSLHG